MFFVCIHAYATVQISDVQICCVLENGKNSTFEIIKYCVVKVYKH